MKTTALLQPLVAGLALLATTPVAGNETTLTEDLLSGLSLRGVGPALQSGRIVDVAIDWSMPDTWYVAAASGGVWKTVNHGTTWQPIFDHYGAYSIGCVTIDPHNPHVVWVGTGENNSQRSAGWGDGVYKSLDGGETFTNMGLPRSEHIGKIVVDPRDSNVVWVAAQGPLWSAGGDRGLYKTTDGGTTWSRSLFVSDDTGISDVVLDPRDPDTVYAAGYQRRRRQWAVVAGGPESAIHKSTDGGVTWRTLARGLPAGPKGRIGIAISPIDPDVLYATVPGLPEEQGFFRSKNRGESWTKMSDWVAIDPQYYQELFPDPHRHDRLYAVSVFLQVTEDGGATFERVPSDHKHVDNHALVIDPQNPDHLISGTDGGLYESYDRGVTWRFFDNLPITQFYRIGIDDQEPFYWVYGGTQDNDSVGAPSRTASVHGIRNSDWIHTSFGDGYQTRVEPGNADVVYSMWQYGELMRFDRPSGEKLDVKPLPGPGEAPYTWNWDAPFLISPHDPKRLYFAGNRLFRSDDRATTWTAISGDLDRGIDRNALPVMGRVWSVDAVWKNVFTSFYGNATSLDESPLVEGLLYVGTDDGLIQITDDDGAHWRRLETFPGVPERTLVSDLTASRHAPDRIYALFNNHKSGDFTPYALKSDDRGGTWASIADGLPQGHIAWSIVEDHVDPQRLFLGTELGLFTSSDLGASWLQLTGGLPLVAVRDLEIQTQADDLVVGTFGRGIFILDDLGGLRGLTPEALDAEGALLPIREAVAFIPSQPMGWDEKGVQGDTIYTAPNPPFGALITYVLKEDLRSRRDARLAEEAARRDAGEDVPYPPWDDLQREDRESAPAIVLTVTDDQGRQVARFAGPAAQGLHRVAWNLRRMTRRPVRDAGGLAVGDEPEGPPVPPGTYAVQLGRRIDGVTEPLGSPQTVVVRALGRAATSARDRADLAEFQQEVEMLVGAVYAAWETLEDASDRARDLRAALDRADETDPALAARLRDLRRDLMDARDRFVGDETIARRAEPAPLSLFDRVDRAATVHWFATAAPTTTHRRAYEAASTALSDAIAALRPLIEVTLEDIAAAAESDGAPWTQGSGLPDWPR